MLLITCPWCGDRDETEFSFGGPADITLPPETADDAAWADFLFYRETPEGEARERWCHDAGCRRWFVAVRDLRTSRFPAPPAADRTPAHAATG